ncbi:MAG: hypothetical protein ACFFDH_10690 [Promethearchaeota archaeon]
MSFELSEFVLGFLLTLLSQSISIGIQVVILVLGYLIHKRISSTYGRYFMVSAICSILSLILMAFILNISASIFIRALFLLIPTSISIIGTVFLILAIYKVYDTHRMDTIEQKIA